MQSRRQVQKAAKARPPAAHVISGQRVTREALEEARQRDARLEPDQVQSRTGVDAEAEGHVPVRLAVNVEAVRIAELRRIAVRATDADVDTRVRWQFQTRDLDLLRRDAVAQLNRAVEAQELFDCSLE